MKAAENPAWIYQVRSAFNLLIFFAFSVGVICLKLKIVYPIGGLAFTSGVLTPCSYSTPISGVRHWVNLFDVYYGILKVYFIVVCVVIFGGAVDS